MDIPLKILKIDVPLDRRLVCISDIHGELDLFKELLEYVRFCDDDILVLLGDYYSKGSKPDETLDFVMELSTKSNVYCLRGNADAGAIEGIQTPGRLWVDTLPHIIESEHFLFTHAGLSSNNIHEQDVLTCMMSANFRDDYDGEPFEKWLIVGHWPVDNYCHKIPNHSPNVYREKKIISIDGGIGMKSAGQLNAFIIHNGKPSWRSVDKFDTMLSNTATAGSPGTVNVTYNNRFVEVVKSGEEFSRVLHLESNIELDVPTNKIYTDREGKICISDQATDHVLELRLGDIVKIVEEYSDRFYAKIDGEAGWVMARRDKQEANDGVYI
ncbi:MAG: metallophosphoesterase [Defluviitaleaceae bacterium]|nr:metallophosphoesterase [Defluviitaleaceae bacterium]